MKRLAFFTVLTVIFCFTALHIASLNLPAEEVCKQENIKLINYRQKETRLFEFICEHLMGENGEIYSAIMRDDTYKTTLSESVGLMMRYALLRNHRELFYTEFKYFKEYLLVGDKHVKWKAEADINCGAAIDDLRIVRALLDAYDLWEDPAYFYTAGFMQEAIFKNQTAEGRLGEFYDWNIRMRRDAVPLCYLDFYTMYRLQPFNSSWWKVIENSLIVAKNGEIASNSPFYYKYHYYDTGNFSSDEEYVINGGVCLTYTLYTVIHLTEMNEDTGAFADWLKKEMSKGKIYAWYNPYTLEPTNDMESTAIYALAAVYSRKTGELGLYKQLLDRMLDFMVDDDKSPYYGGFGNAETGEFYSFDNLTALWALALLGE